MMMKDPKTGEFYNVDMHSKEQLEEAERLGLVYACMHYFPPEETDGTGCDDLEDIKAFWKQGFGVDINPKNN
jgi:hypothetical protein